MFKKGITITLKNVRISFPSLFQKAISNDYPNAEPAYVATFILDPVEHKESLKEMSVGISQLLENMGTSIDKVRLNNPKGICLRNGNDLENVRPEYVDKYTLKASNKKIRPPVYDKNKSIVLEEDNVIYPGCYVNAIIELFAYDKVSKGVSACLKGVQFSKEGECLSGATINPEEIKEMFEKLNKGELPENYQNISKSTLMQIDRSLDDVFNI